MHVVPRVENGKNAEISKNVYLSILYRSQKNTIPLQGHLTGTFSNTFYNEHTVYIVATDYE